MYLYITLDEAVNRENSTKLINEKINSKICNIEFVDSYISRDYETLIFRTDIGEEQFNNIKSILKDEDYIFEIDRYMKYYYSFISSKDSIDINNSIKKVLNDNGYEFKLSSSHSENGELFMLLKILNINPFDKEELTKIEHNIKSIEVIDSIKKY